MDVTPRYVILPTGAMIDLENIAFVLGTNLNTEYVFLPRQTASPQAPKLTSAEFEAFFAELEKRGLGFRVPRPVEAPTIATK
jgi:hypothetical protein